jgi:hypothetical protein
MVHDTSGCNEYNHTLHNHTQQALHALPQQFCIMIEASSVIKHLVAVYCDVAAHPGVRQLLAHAHQLLEAAGTEPQWLRHGERHFHVAPWTKLVAATQLVALRQAGL